jgi:toxin FitB
MTYLLDTCLISELVTKQPNPQVLAWLDTQPPETLYLSIITIGEIAKGIGKLPESARKKRLADWLNQDLLSRFEHRIIGLDIPTMKLWGNLVGRLEPQGRVLPVMDSLIAVTALQNNLTLVTRNEADFIGTGLAIVNPWSP